MISPSQVLPEGLVFAAAVLITLVMLGVSGYRYVMAGRKIKKLDRKIEILEVYIELRDKGGDA